MARILCVEDNEFTARLVEQMLSQLGHAVEVLRDGDAALARLAGAERYDALVTDLMLPGGADGVAIIRAAAARRPELRILAVSSNPIPPDGGRSMLDEARAAGAHEALRKPVSQAQLAEALARILPPPPTEQA